MDDLVVTPVVAVAVQAPESCRKEGASEPVAPGSSLSLLCSFTTFIMGSGIMC